MKTSYVRFVVGLGLVLGILAVGSARGADLYVGPGETYLTIQAAVDAAASGDTIHVAAGTYVEQVLIDGKDLTLAGAGRGATIIESPASLAVFYTTAYDHHPVVGVQDAVVHLADLTVDGAGQGNANQHFLGADFHNAGGSVVNVEFVRVRDAPFSGAQHGVSLYLYNHDAVARTFTVSGCLVHDYQKNAMALLAAADTPLDLTVSGNETIGAGPTTVTAQNGIQVSGPLVVATVTGNDVRDVAWLGPTWTATGCLLYDCTGSFTGNTLVGCQTGASLSKAAMTVDANTLTVPRPTDFGQGLTVDNLDPAYTKNAGGPARCAQPVDPDLRAPGRAKATLVSTISGNTFLVDAAVADNVGVYGLFAYNYAGYDDLEVTARDNAFTGFEIALIAMDYVPTDGAFLAVDYGANEFRACTAGVYTNLTLTVLAEQCWWGAVDGPGGEGPGSGSEVYGNVDYDPWITDYANLLCVPDPLDLTAAAPAGTVVFDYTGGASGRIYGFSIDVVWDPAVATAGADQFTRPASGGFATTSLFFVQELAPGHVRVDAALGGSVPGIYDGPLFQALFTGAGGAPGGAETPLTVTVNELRDVNNLPLSGLVPDPGLVRVDLAAPSVGAVLVTDTTLASTAWTRDGHTVTVAATVVEDDIASLVCDVTAFGGPLLGLGDAVVAGDVYTWTFGPTIGTGDGPVTAAVTCTDGLGQSAAASDAITADNTPPAALGDLAVAPGHEQVHLAWTEPAADTGSPILGAVFRYAAWGGYPHYAGALPAPPASVEAGDPAGAGPQTGGAWDWAVAARDVYVVAGFVVDFAGNASGPGGSGAATNYWLADTDGDGYVTVVPDIDALGDTYGLHFGETGYDGVCDVGPTMNWSPLGIPNPQHDGYRVQFEDLMIFSLNFGEVDPTLKFAPGAVPALRWEPVDAGTWSLVLAAACPGLKGVHVEAALPDGVGCQVLAGSLLAAQDAPVFLRNIPSHGLDAGLAVIGFGACITGAGELLRVVLDEPQPGFAPRVAARDLLNRELLVELPQPTDATAPAAVTLAQNHPNPFNPQTTIAFTLPRAEHVVLAVFGLDGRLVRTLVDEPRAAGPHAVVWTGRDQAGRLVAAGTYVYALRAGDLRLVRKMTLVK